MKEDKKQAKRLKIAVLFGGRSSEHAVSLQSAAAVLRAMQNSRFEAVPVGITQEGRWLRFRGNAEEIASGAWENGTCTPVTPSPDPADHGLILWEQSGVRKERVDAAFPVLHGKNGEDGTVQGLLELAGIPCVGCGVLASAACMDKDIAHRLVKAAGVDVPPCVVLDAGEINAAAASGAESVANLSDSSEMKISAASHRAETDAEDSSGTECAPSTAGTGVFLSAAEHPAGLSTAERSAAPPAPDAVQ